MLQCKGPILRLLLSGLSLCCTPVPASLPPIYDVEIIVFLHDAAAGHGEQWPRPVRTDRFNGVFPEGEFTELGKSFYTLKDVGYTLERSPGYSVLFHRAWRQLAYDRDEAVAYPVHSIIENGRNSVEGTVKLLRERYLHLDMDLFLMSSNGNPEVLYSDAPGNVPLFELREKRRIKSTELHYFDHPRFGVIARVTPYIPPDAGNETIETNTGDAEPDDSIPLSNPAADDDQLRR
ncbi:MAG: CsiV family protein [Gammaproteobacteria bacterium]|jgi:hypothetical protein